MLDPKKPVVREADVPYLYLCPFCGAPIHFADGFVFCTICGFARKEDGVEIVRKFSAFPIPSTKRWNLTPRYYCKKCGGNIVDSLHAIDHSDDMIAYIREYHFGCGGTHATFRVYPFRKLPRDRGKNAIKVGSKKRR